MADDIDQQLASLLMGPPAGPEVMGRRQGLDSAPAFDPVMLLVAALTGGGSVAASAGEGIMESLIGELTGSPTLAGMIAGMRPDKLGMAAARKAGKKTAGKFGGKVGKTIDDFDAATGTSIITPDGKVFTGKVEDVHYQLIEKHIGKDVHPAKLVQDGGLRTRVLKGGEANIEVNPTSDTGLRNASRLLRNSFYGERPITLDLNIKDRITPHSFDSGEEAAEFIEKLMSRGQGGFIRPGAAAALGAGALGAAYGVKKLMADADTSRKRRQSQLDEAARIP